MQTGTGFQKLRQTFYKFRCSYYKYTTWIKFDVTLILQIQNIENFDLVKLQIQRMDNIV